MPEIGSKQALSPLKAALAGVKRAAETAAQAIVEQAHKQAHEIETNGQLVVKKMETEHREAMDMFNDVLGNERAEDQG